MIIGRDVPWNASWSAEDGCEIRPCRYAGGQLALWQPFRPGRGKPLFAKPHYTRQRKSIAEARCSVCGEDVEPGDRWWFPFGEWRQDWWTSTESPVHRVCANLAMDRCPVIRRKGAEPIPSGATILYTLLGGTQFEADFGVKTQGRNVIGHLKFGWQTPDFLEPPPDARYCKSRTNSHAAQGHPTTGRQRD